MNTEQLRAVLDGHKLWLDGAGGQRADLTGANLSEAYLRGADLTGAYLRGAHLSKTILQGKQIYNFQFQKSMVFYAGNNIIRIGCMELGIPEWLESYEMIGALERYTEEQIEAYGNFIKYCASLEKK